MSRRGLALRLLSTRVPGLGVSLPIDNITGWSKETREVEEGGWAPSAGGDVIVIPIKCTAPKIV